MPVLTAEPDSGFVPLQDPRALQLVAFLVVHVKEAVPPAVIEIGFTPTCTGTMGGTGSVLTATVTL